MPTPSIQTLRADAQQVLNLDSISAVRSVVAATLANANAGTPLNPNLTTQQLWNEFYQIVTQPKSDIESIIANQLMKFLFAPPAPGGAGADKQVIFNDGGVLAGDPQFLWDKTTNLLTVTGAATITGDLTVDTSTLKVDSTNNRVGIVQATPLYPLHLVGEFGLQEETPAGSGTKLRLIGDATKYNFRLGKQLTASNTFEITPSTAIGGTTFSNPVYTVTYDGIHTFLDGAGGTRMTLNSTGLGVGVTPSAWATYKGLQVGYASLAGYAGSDTLLGSNVYFDGGAFRYISTATASSYRQLSGVHQWNTAASGTAGNAITFTQAMTLDATRNLSVNTTAYIGVGAGIINSTGGLNIVPDNTGSASNRNWNIAANGGAAGNLDFAISSANNTFPNFAYRMQLTSAGALNNTTGTYGTISDLRLKENISDARNYLADLLKLRVVKYSLKEESSAVATKLGFIAQEVEQVFPNLVDQSDVAYDGGEGIRSVKTSILIPMLLKAIQELTARVEALEA